MIASNASSMKMRNKTIIKIVLFSIALCFRISYYTLEGNISRDGIQYILLAEEWNQTGEYENALSVYTDSEARNWVPPLLPGILLFFIRIGVNPLYWGAGFSILCGSLLVLPIFELGFLLSGKIFAATLAGLFIACNSFLCDNSADILREPLYLLFSAYMLVFACKAIATGNNWLWIGSGVFQGLSFLSRFEAIEYWAWMGIYLIYLVSEKKKHVCRIGVNYYAGSVFTILLISILFSTEKQILDGVSRMLFHLTGKYI